MKKFLFILAACLVLAALLAGCLSSGGGTGSLYHISGPYTNINWETFEQYKTALHVHTQNSDGANPLSSVIFDHYNKGFHILAITDHDFLTESWITAPGGLTQTQYNAIADGSYQNRGFGMIEIPDTNEHSRYNHLNTFFIKYNNSNPEISNFEQLTAGINNLGGLSHVNHPGRYTGGSREDINKESTASFNSTWLNLYTRIFLNNPNCVGMEIINKKDDESRSDRIFWDNVLMRTIPQGRNVWGFSNDDTHSNQATGFSFNIFIMQENTLENFRDAMLTGSFYAVARISRREGFLPGGSSDNLNLPTPVIRNITINNPGVITILAENYNRIDWISNGKVIASGNTINLSRVRRALIGSYVRANVIGNGGVAFTQPMVIN